MSETISDIGVLKSRLQATWAAGNFGEIAKSYKDGASEFIDRLNITTGIRVLDVACGTGNLALPCARAGASVTGVDIAPNLLEQGRNLSKAEGLSIRFDEGDVENLPYPDNTFDLVVTMFGAMFAPRPEKTAAELVRVCRPGGRIAMANWVPSGFIGQVFKTTTSRVPPPPGVPSPLLWGDEATVRERLQKGTSALEFARCFISFKFPFAPTEVVEFWRQFYGPTQRAFAALDADGQAAFRKDLEGLWTAHNKGNRGSTLVESEYLQVVALRT